MEEKQEYKAYPFHHWILSDSETNPTLAILTFLIEAGSFSVLLNKEMLLELSKAFVKEAKKLPYKADLH